MDAVICYCQRCGHELGRFQNAWHGIGNTYCSPVYPMLTFDEGFKAVGEPYPATAGSTIAHSFLRDLRCTRCGTSVGLRCHNAPEKHILVKDQLILQISFISVVSASSKVNTNISIVKTFPLKVSTKNSSDSRRESTVLPVSRRISENLHLGTEITPSVHVSGMLSPPSIERKAPNFSKFQEWAQEAINSQQRDIDRVSGTVARIEGEMQRFKDFMKEAQVELTEGQRLRQTRSMDQQLLASLQVDLNHLNAKVDKSNDGRFHGKSGVSLSRDIEIIISDMLTVSNKANEVDDVKTSLQQVKGQLKAFENIATKSNAKQDTATFQASQKVSETDALRGELQELRGRLNSVQHALDRLPTQENRDDNQASSRNRKHGQAEGSSKIVGVESKLQPDVPRKRKRGRPKTIHEPLRTDEQPYEDPRDRVQSPKTNFIDIISSKNVVPPILNKHDHPEPPNMARDTENANYSLLAETSIEDTTAFNPTTTGPIIEKGSPLRKTTSTNNLVASTPGSLNADSVSKPKTVRYQPDASYIWNQDTHAAIQTPGGRIKRRSLRNYSQDEIAESAVTDDIKGLGDGEEKDTRGGRGFTTPHQIGILPKSSNGYPQSQSKEGVKGTTASSADARPAVIEIQNINIPEELIRPSVERNKQQAEPEGPAVPSPSPPTPPAPNIQNGTQSESALESKTSRIIPKTKSYKCQSCPKQYSRLAGLVYHKRNSTCKNQVLEENSEDTKKAQLLTAREKLVTEILERETTSI